MPKHLSILGQVKIKISRYFLRFFAWGLFLNFLTTWSPKSWGPKSRGPKCPPEVSGPKCRGQKCRARSVEPELSDHPLRAIKWAGLGIAGLSILRDINWICCVPPGQNWWGFEFWIGTDCLEKSPLLTWCCFSKPRGILFHFRHFSSFHCLKILRIHIDQLTILMFT
jgi:hypothetical protein